MKRKRLALFLITGVSIFLVAIGIFLSVHQKSNRNAQLLDQEKKASTFYRAKEVLEQENVGGDDRIQPLPRRASSSRSIVAPSLRDTEETSPYQVIAIFYGRNDEKSSAVVITNEVEIGQYHVGEILPNQHLLYAISPDHVVIHDGKVVHIARLSSHADNRMLDQSGSPSSTTLKKTARPFSIINPELFSSKNIREDREKLLKINDLTPVSDSSASGYIIGERFYPKVLDKIGAEPGDTIVSVNGYNVGNEAGDVQAAESFRRSGAAFVIILTQEGRNLILEYP